ncbi:hypothetical protein BH18ACT3_BH18ACT3_19900 [soil metagenome]
MNDKRVDVAGERCRFRSSILTPWARRSPKVTEVLPMMYLHGMSTGDFAPALAGFFGTAAGLSPSVITRLTAQWQAEQRAFAERRLDDRDYVYVWADGVHFNVRLDESGCVAWSSSACEETEPRSWWRSPMASGSRRSRGPTCCAT